MSVLVNPFIIYSIVWGLVLLLTSMQLTTNLSEISESTWFLVCGNIIMFGVIYTFLRLAFHLPQKIIVRAELITELDSIVTKLFKIWIICVLIEIIYFRGFALLWIFTNDDMIYTDFGIIILHVVVGGIYRFLEIALFLIYIISGNKKYLWKVIFLLFWPIMTVARGLFITIILQIMGLYLLFRRISIKKSFLLIMLAFILIYLFGITGDYRVNWHNNENPFIILIDSKGQYIFDKLPSGFLWVYVYLTSPLSNINSNIDNITPSYLPYNSLATLPLKHFFQQETRSDFKLVEDNLNVSTFYYKFLLDFGIFGAFTIITIIQLITAIIYFYCRAGKIWGILIYPIFFQCIVLSVFSDIFLYSPTICQILITLYFGFKISSKSKYVK